MKIHIVQRNDTFQSIAEKYNVSVQDLIGMNTHINHLTGLVPGLKVKVPSPARKEESNVAQHIQKYYPNLDTSPIELKTVTTVEPEPVVVKQEAPIVQQVQQVEQVQQVQQAQPAPVQQVQQAQQVQQPTPTQVTKVKEEAIPVPLKPIQTEVPIQPNDGVKVGIGGVAASVEQYNVSVNQKNYQQSNQTTAQTQTQGVAAQPLPYPLPLTPSMLYSPYKPSCSSGPMPYPAPYANPYAVGPYVNPYPVSYGTPFGAAPYGMRSPQDERFFIGGFGYPFFGGWGWGGYYPYYGGWGWGGYPSYGGWYRNPYL